MCICKFVTSYTYCISYDLYTFCICLYIVCVYVDIGGTIGAEEAPETVAMMTAAATDMTTDAMPGV